MRRFRSAKEVATIPTLITDHRRLFRLILTILVVAAVIVAVAACGHNSY
jgi:hypothetical protein